MAMTTCSRIIVRNATTTSISGSFVPLARRLRFSQAQVVSSRCTSTSTSSSSSSKMISSTSSGFLNYNNNNRINDDSMIRLKSTVVSPETTTSASSANTNQCPHAAKANKTNGASAQVAVQKLVDVPKLPFVGSMIPQYSGAHPYDLTKSYDVWYSHYQRFGKFYNMGFPGIGRGLLNEVHVLTDPNEFMKVLRKEGTHPFGAISNEWPFISYYQELQKQKTKDAADGTGSGSCDGSADVGLALFSNGEEWQKPRRFMQTDLLHPTAAKGYIPGMIMACKTASLGAPNHASNINNYSAYCSFDMFSSIMFGEFPGLAASSSSTATASDDDEHQFADAALLDRKEEEENLKFCKSTVIGLEAIIPMLVSPLELLKNKMGIKSKLYTTFEENFSVSRSIALKKLKLFQQRKKNGGLENDFQKLSYASLATDRYYKSLGEGDSLEKGDVAELIMVALIAALDTTSSMLNWCIIHLAMNPHVQDELYKEIMKNGVDDADDGKVKEEYFTKSKNTKYLDAFLRENHRITPPVAINLMKENVVDDIDIHGKTIPKGSMFILDSRSVGMDPNYVNEPNTFNPSRWLVDSDSDSDLDKDSDLTTTTTEKSDIEIQKVLDHPLYRAPFSAGARKCPGSRVATYEVKILLSQLVLDWKITLASTPENEKIKNWRDISYFQGLTIQPDVPQLSFEKR